MLHLEFILVFGIGGRTWCMKGKHSAVELLTKPLVTIELEPGFTNTLDFLVSRNSCISLICLLAPCGLSSVLLTCEVSFFLTC